MDKKINEYKNISYSNKPDCVLDIYTVEKSDKTLIYIHGGGLTGGNKTEGTDLFGELLKNGISVISIDYTMYPKAKYPEFFEDSAAAIKWIIMHQSEYGYAKDYTVFGTSAGAHIAAMLCFDERYLKSAGVELAELSNFVFHSPQPTVHFTVIEQSGVDPRKVIIDSRSPIYYIEEKQYPQMFLLVYTQDIPGRYEQCLMFSKTLELYNIPHRFEVKEGAHCSGQFYGENKQISILDSLLNFIKGD